MKAIYLGDWSAYYPGGVSRVLYCRIGRAIRAHGSVVRVCIRPGDFDSLRAALDELDECEK